MSNKDIYQRLSELTGKDINPNNTVFLTDFDVLEQDEPMTVFDKIREYVLNVTAYPYNTETMDIKQFMEFLNKLEQEQDNDHS